MTDMLRQIFKQLWFYRRSNSWLFIELVIIIAVSWFLVHQTWTPRYRINNVPDGIKSEGVYIVSFDLLQPGHKDYDPQADGEEAWSRDFSRIMDRIRSMPEVQCAVPTTDFFPGLGAISAGGLQLDSLTYISLLSIDRAMGENDFEVFGYEVVWPKDGRIDDSQPMSMIITEDLAEYVFPGENPIGKNLESACAEPDMEYGWTTPIVGVIRSIRQSGSSDNIPGVADDEAILFRVISGSGRATRLKPEFKRKIYTEVDKLYREALDQAHAEEKTQRRSCNPNNLNSPNRPNDPKL